MPWWMWPLVGAGIWIFFCVVDWLESSLLRREAENNLKRKQAEDLMVDLRSLKNGPHSVKTDQRG